jgi:hypothetical protein
MTLLEELIAREYFEKNGFFIKRLDLAVESTSNSKFAPIPLTSYFLQRETGRTKNQDLPDRFQLFSSDVGGLALGTLTIVPWQSSGLSLQIFQSPTRYRSWIRNTVCPSISPIQEAVKGEKLPVESLPILLLPGIPAHDPHRKDIVELLQKSGIKAIFTLRTLLESLIHQIDTHSHTPDSALSEILKLLSVYDLISPPQLDLFDDL